MSSIEFGQGGLLSILHEFHELDLTRSAPGRVRFQHPNDFRQGDARIDLIGHRHHAAKQRGHFRPAPLVDLVWVDIHSEILPGMPQVTIDSHTILDGSIRQVVEFEEFAEFGERLSGRPGGGLDTLLECLRIGAAPGAEPVRNRSEEGTITGVDAGPAARC